MYIKNMKNLIIPFCILLLSAGCNSGPESQTDESAPDSARVRSYTSPDTLIKQQSIGEWESVNGVSLKLDYYEDAGSNPVLAVTFNPQDGFHLYGINLDTEKTEGLGRPTKANIKSSNNSIYVAGELLESVTADEKPNETLGVSVPVYPEGPVTLFIPVEINPGESGISGSVVVSYMACKDDGVCLRPVNDREHSFTMAVANGK